MLAIGQREPVATPKPGRIIENVNVGAVPQGHARTSASEFDSVVARLLCSSSNMEQSKYMLPAEARVVAMVAASYPIHCTAQNNVIYP
jgi:hypothetical protein